MTVDHNQADAAFHSFPSGDRTYAIELDNLPQPEADGEDLEDLRSWSAGAAGTLTPPPL